MRRGYRCRAGLAGCHGRPPRKRSRSGSSPRRSRRRGRPPRRSDRTRRTTSRRGAARKRPAPGRCGPRSAPPPPPRTPRWPRSPGALRNPHRRSRRKPRTPSWRGRWSPDRPRRESIPTHPGALFRCLTTEKRPALVAGRVIGRDLARLAAVLGVLSVLLVDQLLIEGQALVVERMAEAVALRAQIGLVVRVRHRLDRDLIGDREPITLETQ